jgi:3'-5' exoribonuclease
MMRSTLSPEAQFARIRALVAQVRNGHIKTLLDSFLDDPAIQPLFLKAPAATRIHHAFVGGLCEHTLSVVELGWRICDH